MEGYQSNNIVPDTQFDLYTVVICVNEANNYVSVY